MSNVSETRSVNSEECLRIRRTVFFFVEFAWPLPNTFWKCSGVHTLFRLSQNNRIAFRCQAIDDRFEKDNKLLRHFCGNIYRPSIPGRETDISSEHFTKTFSENKKTPVHLSCDLCEKSVGKTFKKRLGKQKKHFEALFNSYYPFYAIPGKLSSPAALTLSSRHIVWSERIDLIPLTACFRPEERA